MSIFINTSFFPSNMEINSKLAYEYQVDKAIKGLNDELFSRMVSRTLHFNINKISEIEIYTVSNSKYSIFEYTGFDGFKLKKTSLVNPADYSQFFEMIKSGYKSCKGVVPIPYIGLSNVEDIFGKEPIISANPNKKIGLEFKAGLFLV